MYILSANETEHELNSILDNSETSYKLFENLIADGYLSHEARYHDNDNSMLYIMPVGRGEVLFNREALNSFKEIIKGKFDCIAGPSEGDMPADTLDFSSCLNDDEWQTYLNDSCGG
jgi:hypothetical protein